jgi:hypothetical protein
MPAKRKGDEVRIPTSIRIQPKDKKRLTKHFGSVQKALDFMVDSLNAYLKEKENKNE